MRQLGGHPIPSDRKGDAAPAAARRSRIRRRVLSRYVDAIMIRILDHDSLAELRGPCQVPVIKRAPGARIRVRSWRT